MIVFEMNYFIYLFILKYLIKLRLGAEKCRDFWYYESQILCDFITH